MYEKIEKSLDSRRIDLPGKILVAHQPEFFPWLGNISKATMGDIYLILDIVQFKKKYFENRNKIKVDSNSGWCWINAPCKDIKNHYHRSIDVEIIEDQRWKTKLIKQLQYNYSKAKYFEKIMIEIEHIIQREYIKLVDLNIEIIKYAFQKFDINIPVMRVSDLMQQGYEIVGSSNDLIISMCKVYKADVYVFGKSGKDYIDRDKFKANSILPVFQKFTHPQYHQLHGDFVPYMSFIDLLFNYGDESIKMLGHSDYEY